VQNRVGTLSRKVFGIYGAMVVVKPTPRVVCAGYETKSDQSEDIGNTHQVLGAAGDQEDPRAISKLRLSRQRRRKPDCQARTDTTRRGVGSPSCNHRTRPALVYCCRTRKILSCEAPRRLRTQPLPHCPCGSRIRRALSVRWLAVSWSC